MYVRIVELQQAWGGRRFSALEFLCSILSPSIDEKLRRQLMDTGQTPPFRWTELVDLATDHLVAPALARRLDESGLSDSVPKAVSRYFGAVHRLNRIRNTQIDVQCMAIAAALNEIDVVPVFFKGGGAMLAGLYSDPASRVMSDLDILVPADRNSDCVSRLLAFGFGADGAPRHPRDQSYAVLYPESGAAPVDLHRDVVAYPYQDLLSVQQVIAHAIEHNRRGVTFAVPSPTHQLIINVAHAQLHHNHGYIYGRLALRSLLDMSLICRRWGNNIDWCDVEDRFDRIGARTALDFHRIATSESFGPLGLPATACWRARLAFRWSRFLSNHVALMKIIERPLHALLLLRRELSDAELRRRLGGNMRDQRWWSRHLATLRRGGTAAAKPNG